MKKYELLEKNEEGLHRIRALRDFGFVKKGDRGGFIESENNLSHEGDCWIYDNARVYGDAFVFGNARVYGNARIFGYARVYGNARIFGYDWVCDNARLFGDDVDIKDE